MAGRPRPSVLDLFDPLLADAIRVPIPESPPSTPRTPQKSLEGGVENKENVAPNELTMSVFFNRISKHTIPPATKHSCYSLGPLVELEGAEIGSQDDKREVSPRMPLTELSVDEFLTPPTSRIIYGSSNKNALSPSHPRASGSLPPSPLYKTHIASFPFPVISVVDSPAHQDSRAYSPRSVANVNPVLPRELQLQRDSLQTSPSGALMPPDTTISSSLMHSRRRSSIDLSMTLSPLSSCSFHMPDASFDLVNGEISFLSKGSEEDDTGHDVLPDFPEPETPRVRLPPQKPIREEGAVASSGTTDHRKQVPSSPLSHAVALDDHEEEHKDLFEDIPLTTTSAESDVGTTTLLPARHVAVPSQLARDRQRPLSTMPSGSIATIRGGDLPVQGSNTASSSHVSPVNMAGQDTPPSARRVSSVPAPIKKLRVFTSSHQRAALASARRGTAGVGDTNAGTSVIASKTLSKDPISGCGASNNSGLLQGSAGMVGGVGGIAEQCEAKPAAKRPLSANSIATNMKVPSRPVRSIETSAVRNQRTSARAPRAGGASNAVSRLPGPAGIHGATGAVPKQVQSRLPAPTGRSIPVRSTSRIGVGAAKTSRAMEG